MLNLDKKSLHAIEAMLTIASYTGTQPISGKEISADHNLPPRYLEQVLQKLVKAELLRGVRGPRGGYVLAREKRRISLADIIAAVQAENEDTMAELHYKNLRGALEEAGEKVADALSVYTLQDLATPKAPQKKTADFAI